MIDIDFLLAEYISSRKTANTELSGDDAGADIPKRAYDSAEIRGEFMSIFGATPAADELS